jgi:hypothetical protein
VGHSFILHTELNIKPQQQLAPLLGAPANCSRDASSTPLIFTKTAPPGSAGMHAVSLKLFAGTVANMKFDRHAVVVSISFLELWVLRRLSMCACAADTLPTYYAYCLLNTIRHVVLAVPAWCGCHQDVFFLSGGVTADSTSAARGTLCGAREGIVVTTD